MLEYRILKTKVGNAEEEINRLAEQDWKVIDASLIQGMSLTVNGTPMVVTLERQAPSL